MVDTSTIQKVSERIRSRSEELGISQADVHRQTGAAKSSISAWYNGNNIPRGNNVTKLCRTLRCTHDWLLSGTGKPSSRSGGDLFAALPGTWEIDQENSLSKLFKVPALRPDGENDFEDVDIVSDLVVGKVDNPAGLCWIEVKSRSASPDVAVGDRAIVDSLRKSVTDSGAFYVIAHASGMSVHQIHVELNGGWTVTDASRPTAPATVDASQVDTIGVLGRVVWRSGAVN